MFRLFILRDQEVCEAPDAMTWAEWMSTADRRVAQTNVGDDVRVSTIFLGMDHNFLGKGPPVLWETMIFGGKHSGWVRRYTTRAKAEAGHLDAVELARKSVAAPHE